MSLKIREPHHSLDHFMRESCCHIITSSAHDGCRKQTRRSHHCRPNRQFASISNVQRIVGTERAIAYWHPFAAGTYSLPMCQVFADPSALPEQGSSSGRATIENGAVTVLRVGAQALKGLGSALARLQKPKQ